MIIEWNSGAKDQPNYGAILNWSAAVASGFFQIIEVGFSGVVRIEDQIGLPKIVAVVDIETWEDHFLDQTWDQIQDQIAAGYPYYIQPMEGAINGEYYEIIDYGIVINNVIINIDWDEEHIVDGVAVSTQISHSLDNITYSTPVTGSSLYAASFRYVKVKFIFDGTAGGLVAISHFKVLLDVKRELDSGSILAIASDVGGTQVNFNKSFADIDSITCTDQDAQEPITVFYDFVDIVYPVGFKVFAVDSTGVRVTHLVSWKARGTIA